MKTDRTRIIVGFCIITIIWSSTWFAIKLGLQTVPPFFGVAIRFTVALIILSILMKVRREAFPLDKSALYIYFVIGLFSISIPFALVYWGEQFIPSGLASILFAAYPFVVALGSHFLLPAEPLNSYKVSGILTGFTGLVVIFWADLHLGEASLIGMGSIILSTLLSGTSLVFVKRSPLHLSPVVMNFGGLLIAVSSLWVIAFIAEDIGDVRPDGVAIASILYLGTFGTVVTFLIYYWLLKRVEAVYLSLVTMITPALAVMLGAFYLNEELSVRTFIGASLVLLGVLVSNGREIGRTILKGHSRMFPTSER